MFIVYANNLVLINFQKTLVMVLKTTRTFLSLIKECHAENQWTDVSLRHHGATLACHKFVLGTASTVLHEALVKTDPGGEAEQSIIFDTGFERSDIEQLLSYVYGVSSSLPDHLLFLFPSNLQVKPDIKRELEESSSHIKKNDIPLWDLDWQNGHSGIQNSDFKYDYTYDNYYDDDMKNFINDDDDDDYDDRPRKKKPFKRVTTTNGEKKYECPYCQKQVNKLPKHVFSAHQDHWHEFNESRGGNNRKKSFPKQCPHCPKQLTCNWHYERHIKTHMEPREKKVKKEKIELNDEMGSFVCVQCGEEFPNKKALKSHEYKHKNEIACEFKDCNEVFLSYLAYSNHMLFKHQKVVKRRKCHARVKSGNADEDAIKKKDQEEKKHLCTECGRGFREADSLKKHVIFVHTERAIPTCICNVCGKKFKTNNKLKNHMLLHEPPTLPCPFCDKLFETDHKVKKHIKSTHVQDDQKLYQCTYCQKGFSHFPSYESHMNSHKNVRPYQCHLCDNAYQNHFNLQQHVKKNHGVLISSNHNT